jgi:hypothetical protein
MFPANKTSAAARRRTIPKKSPRPILRFRHNFDSLEAPKGRSGVGQRFEVVGRTPATARRKNCRSSRAGRFDAVYLRAAQAYMLISMPTGTSTIFGAFQIISFSQVWRDTRRLT